MADEDKPLQCRFDLNAGSGTALGELTCFTSVGRRGRAVDALEAALDTLHTVVYGRRGSAGSRRAALAQFRGLPSSMADDVLARLRRCDKAKLQAMVRALHVGVGVNSTRDALAQAVTSFLRCPKDEGGPLTTTTRRSGGAGAGRKRARSSADADVNTRADGGGDGDDEAAAAAQEHDGGAADGEAAHDHRHRHHSPHRAHGDGAADAEGDAAAAEQPSSSQAGAEGGHATGPSTSSSSSSHQRRRTNATQSSSSSASTATARRRTASQRGGGNGRRSTRSTSSRRTTTTTSTTRSRGGGASSSRSRSQRTQSARRGSARTTAATTSSRSRASSSGGGGGRQASSRGSSSSGRRATRGRTSSPSTRPRRQHHGHAADDGGSGGAHGPSSDAVRVQIYERVLGLTPAQRVGLGLKQLRHELERHFGLDEGALKPQRDLIARTASDCVRALVEAEQHAVVTLQVKGEEAALRLPQSASLARDDSPDKTHEPKTPPLSTALAPVAASSTVSDVVREAMTGSKSNSSRPGHTSSSSSSPAHRPSPSPPHSQQTTTAAHPTAHTVTPPPHGEGPVLAAALTPVAIAAAAVHAQHHHHNDGHDGQHTDKSAATIDYTAANARDGAGHTMTAPSATTTTTTPSPSARRGRSPRGDRRSQSPSHPLSFTPPATADAAGGAGGDDVLARGHGAYGTHGLAHASSEQPSHTAAAPTTTTTTHVSHTTTQSMPSHAKEMHAVSAAASDLPRGSGMTAVPSDYAHTATAAAHMPPAPHAQAPPQQHLSSSTSSTSAFAHHNASNSDSGNGGSAQHLAYPYSGASNPHASPSPFMSGNVSAPHHNNNNATGHNSNSASTSPPRYLPPPGDGMADNMPIV